MFVLTEKNEIINLDHAVKISPMKAKDHEDKDVFAVIAYTYAPWTKEGVIGEIMSAFSNQKDAEDFMIKLADAIDGFDAKRGLTSTL